ncbi:DNA-directed RNA polymerase III subunit rpc5 [Physcia stellaris]|nr:DNA-directed RNA polymerase III subunit rpc5 [Physcia stellaris]
MTPRFKLLVWSCFLLTLTASQVSTDTDYQKAIRFASEVSNSTVTQDRIVQLLVEANHSRQDVRNSSATRAANAALACSIIRVILADEQNTNGIYLDASYAVEYVNREQVNWSDLCWLKARCIITPRTAYEVGLFLKIITFTQAKFAVRSGGHNPNPTWASIGHDGLLVDLNQLNALKLSRDKKLVSIGPGNRWSNVYEYLNASGKFVAGARVPEVGVGGQILGGGLSYFPSQSGLSCDSVQNFEIVLANSSIINANNETNRDLFVALKGGGGLNLGIVTQFDLHTEPYGQAWFELNVYEASRMPQLLAALVDYQKIAESDSKAGLIFSPTSNLTTVGLLYAAPVVRPGLFEKFYSIPAYQTLVSSNIGTEQELSVGFSSPASKPTRFDIVAASTKVDLELYQEIYAAFQRISSNMTEVTDGDATMQISLQPVTTHAVLRGRSLGGNALNLSAEPQQWFASTIQWTDKAYDRAAHEAVVSLGKRVTDLARKRNLSLPFLNPNDATFSQDPIASFGDDSKARLRMAVAKYDPQGVFQQLRSGGFRIS